MATKKKAAKSKGVAAETAVADSRTDKQSAAAKPVVTKMTRTQIVKALAEKLEAEPKQIQSFFEALAELATE